MYALTSPQFPSNLIGMVVKIESNTFIPFDPANTDYQTFKRDLTEGVELQDAEGNVMTAKAVKDFLKTLP